MKKLLLTLLFASGFCALKADDAADYQNFARTIEACRDTTLAPSSKAIHFGFQLVRTEDMDDEAWKAIVCRVADIIIKNTSGDLGTVVAESLDYARSEKSHTTALSFQIGFIDPTRAQEPQA